jgi:cytochrome c biogenesis protein CcmG/thiol:disulfide interchange protein DsbE
VEEAPALMALKAQGVQIIGVAYKDHAPDTQAFLDRYGDPYQAVLTDPTGRAGVEWGISGVPETFAVDAKGQIIAKKSEPLTPQDAEALAESLSR